MHSLVAYHWATAHSQLSSVCQLINQSAAFDPDKMCFLPTFTPSLKILLQSLTLNIVYKL